MRNRLRGLIAAILCFAFGTGHAELISKTTNVTGSNFYLYFGSSLPAPVDPLIIDFTVTFDDAMSASPTTEGLTINSFNLLYGAQFAYDPVDDNLVLATQPLVYGISSVGCSNPNNTFCILIHAFSSSSPTVYYVQQTTSGGGAWNAGTIDLRVTPVTTVPEPGTFALLGLGLAGLAFTRGRQQ